MSANIAEMDDLATDDVDGPDASASIVHTRGGAFDYIKSGRQRLRRPTVTCATARVSKPIDLSVFTNVVPVAFGRSGDRESHPDFEAGGLAFYS